MGKHISGSSNVRPGACTRALAACAAALLLSGAASAAPPAPTVLPALLAPPALLALPALPALPALLVPLAPPAPQVQQVDPVAPPRQPDAVPEAPIVRPAHVPDAVTLGNSLVELAFDVDGTLVELESIRNVGAGQPPILCEPGAGGWTIRLMRPGTQAKDWVEVSMDGTFVTGPQASCAGAACHLDELDLVRVLPFGDDVTGEMAALWRGRLTAGSSAVAFEVETRWEVVPGEPLADTTIRVELSGVGGRLEHYLSEVRYPRVEVTAFDSPDDTLVLPYRTGSLVTNPTEYCFPKWIGTGADSMFGFSVELLAYHDGDPLTPNCLYFTTDDVDCHFKRLVVETSSTTLPSLYDEEECAEPGEAGSVTFGMRHVPDDVFASNTYTTPYAVRLGAIVGDWWDVAARYRAFLTSEAPWYYGPTGSPSNSGYPNAARRIAASIVLQPGYEGDNADALAQAFVDVARILGRNIHMIWYQWHRAPFDRFLVEPYAPGVPSFASAVETAQAQWNFLVAPYVNGSKGSGSYDKDEQTGPCTPQGSEEDVDAARLVREDGKPVHITTPNDPSGFGVVLCNGTTWWKQELADEIVATAAVAGNRGVYLDFLEIAQAPCYATDHDHAPGGGNWMFTARAEQLSAMAAGLAALPEPPSPFIVSMETAHGWFAPYVHLMHVDPAENLLSVLNPALPTAMPMPNACTIPFFRAVFDNVRLSRVTHTRFVPSERRAWVDASVLTNFGQVPAFVEYLTDAIAPFSERAESGLYNEWLGPPSSDGGDDSEQVTPIATYDKQPAVVARNRWLTARVASAMRGDIFGASMVDAVAAEGGGGGGGVGVGGGGDGADGGLTLRRDLLAWHTGTLVRLPSISITPPVGFDGIPGIPEHPDTGRPNTPADVEEYLTPGMYQAPVDLPGADAGSLCLVLVNPWIGPEHVDADFVVDFTVPLWRYPGWEAVGPYTVTMYDVDGDDEELTPTGPLFDLGVSAGPATLEPGDVVWWVFRKS